MKSIILSVVLLCLSQIQYAFADNIKSQFNLLTKYQQALTKAPLLYVLKGANATITNIKGEKSMYEIRVNNVSSMMTYFSNRPNRIAGMVPTKYFFDSWNKGHDSFSMDPPNAALTARMGNQNLDYIFELEKPRYDAGNNTIIVKGKLLQGRVQALNENLKNINLFIDFHWHNNIP